jgi:hypothetical protein
MALTPAQLAALAIEHVGLGEDRNPPRRKLRVKVRRKPQAAEPGKPEPRGVISVQTYRRTPSEDHPQQKPDSLVSEKRGDKWWVTIVRGGVEKEVFTPCDKFTEAEAIRIAKRCF